VGNHILINGGLEYGVVDSKMEAFMEYLEENGYEMDTGIKRGAVEVTPESTWNSPTLT